MSKLFTILSCTILLAISGCATIYNPATEQNEFIFITTPAEVSIGKAFALKISKQFKISRDTKKIERVKRIGKRIAGVSDRKDLTYHFNIIEDDALNAFTGPGGYIYVNSGVMEKASDDELACIIGHEAGHVAARHIVKKLQAQIGYDILMNIAARRTNLGELQRAASLSYNLIILGYSRKDELLADRLGVKYAYKAGYEPYAMVSFLKKLEGTSGKDIGPVFLRSHPYISQRIRMLEMQIPGIIERERAKNNALSREHSGKRTSLAAADNAPNARPLKVMCPKCRRIFPGRTNYCPYDGTRLK